MNFLTMMALVGGLLLLLALSSAYVQRLPVSGALIYLGVGLLLGPLGLGWLALDLQAESPWMEHLTEVAVIVSLFVGGLRLRLPLRHPAWRAPVRLAGPVMLASIAGVALLGHFLLGLEPAMALLLGALLAPTDPVLASALSVHSAADHDRMRYGLSGEAGLNDGAAFPFVVLALLWMEEGALGPWVGEWALHRLLWAVPAGLGFGFLLAQGVGRLAIWLRSTHRDTAAPSDFLALALIALAYTGAEFIGAWGFLAVFAAGVGLRRAEMNVVRKHPHPDVEHGTVEQGTVEQGTVVQEDDVILAADLRAGAPVDSSMVHPPAEDLVPAQIEAEDLQEPAVAAGTMVAEVLSFGDTVERLLEVLLVLLVGVTLAEYWDPAALWVAGALFIVIRPLSALPLLAGTTTTRAQRLLMGWFGIRGIGTLYYLSYALNHGVDGAVATELVGLTVSVVGLSILAHGVSARPLLDLYERRLRADG